MFCLAVEYIRIIQGGEGGRECLGLKKKKEENRFLGPPRHALCIRLLGAGDTGICIFMLV